MQITCEGCAGVIRITPEIIGRRIRCKACNHPQVVKDPRPPEKTEPIQALSADQAKAKEEEPTESVAALRVAEVEDAPEPAPKKKPKKAVSGDDWGEELLTEQEVPAEYVADFQEVLEAGERITWAGRPRLDILLARAAKIRLISILVFVGMLIVMPSIAAFLFTRGVTPAYIAGGVVLFLMLVFLAVSFFGILYPNFVKKNASHRACYALTNRRLLIIKGKGGGIQFSGGANDREFMTRDQAKKMIKQNQGKVQTLEPVDILGLHRVLDPKFPGSGEVYVERTLFEESGGMCLNAINDVVEVERRIRQELLHPAIEELLAGKISSKDFTPKAKHENNATVEEQTTNMTKNTADPETLDELRKLMRRSLKEAIDEEKEQVKAELVEGEELLWIGRPEAKAKGKGMMGLLSNSPENKEPRYTLYALTNRRVLLWADKTSRGNSFLSGKIHNGPMSYYTPDLMNIRAEDDDRLEEGGNLIFKIVRLKIVTETTSQNARGGTQTKTSTQIEHHRYGLLRINNFIDVGDAIYHFLVRPVRRGGPKV